MTGGDFVRTMRQVIDLCQQVADVAEDPDTRRAASRAVSAAMRGVIVDAVAGAPGGGDDDPAG